MVEVVEELKAGLARIDARIEELRREIVGLYDQKSAFEKVIKVYDPGFDLTAPLRAPNDDSRDR